MPQNPRHRPQLELMMASELENWCSPDIGATVGPYRRVCRCRAAPGAALAAATPWLEGLVSMAIGSEVTLS